MSNPALTLLGIGTGRGARWIGGPSRAEESSARSDEGEHLPSVGGCGAGVVTNPGLVFLHWARSPAHVNREKCLLLLSPGSGVIRERGFM